MSINTGGPAFPHQDWDATIHSPRREHGMSLRAYFAGLAMQGLYAGGAFEEMEVFNQRRNVVSAAILAADHLIAELEKEAKP